ncbi:MAG: M48 family metallopeptidase [Deltaproteobacteria bacterium]|nr:M48 family metallopeptidase [Deltaproteobacteria bacterium]
MGIISFNWLTLTYLLVFTITLAADLFIDYLNVKHLKLKGDHIPEGLHAIIDADKLKNINHYTIDNAKLSIIRTIIEKMIFLGMILFGLFPIVADYLDGFHFIPAGLCFFAVLGFITAVINLPFELFQIFNIEERYGFNTRTFGTWIIDLLKSLMVGIFLGGILLTSLLLIIQYAPETWWILAWLFFFLFQILMMAIYPTMIAPLFNRFVPIEDNELAEKIRSLAEQEGLNIKDIYQMDAARRSRHTNAYFTGLGKTKRIVLFDTLLRSHNHEEILAILSHEIGHLKGKHILKQTIIMGVVTFFLFFIASLMLDWKTLYDAFQFPKVHPYIGVFLIATVWEPAEFFLSPIVMAISRKFEREADQYIFRTPNRKGPFIHALKNMARDNLANLYPHPLYVLFNYSHPPILKRIHDLTAETAPVNSIMDH